MSTEANKAIVKKMWQVLSEMDWATMKSCMHPEIFYEDVPTDDVGAKGPENCVKRLQIAFNHLSKQEQTTHHLAGDGFCTMHEIKDGLVYRWSDFWDMNKFVGQFPQWFLEEMMKASEADFS